MIDPGLVDIQKEMLQAYAEQLEVDQRREMIKSIEESNFDVTLLTVLSGFAKGAIGGFILSLIISSITKRESIES